MSTYTNDTLQHDEKIIQVARLHWVIYTKSLVYVLLAFTVVIAAYATFGVGEVATVIVSGLLLAAARAALQAWWYQFTTEITVTDKRVIYKTGFIRRHTDEMFRSQIESVYVDQSIPGRILRYGSVHCRGTGEGMEHLHYIADPIAMQNALNEN